MFDNLLDVVGYVYSQGVVYWDFKFENIMVCVNDMFKVLDFGIVKDEGLGKIKIGVGMGIVNYMVFEQYIDVLKVDVWVDIYVLGMILYEMLVGCLFWVFGMIEFEVLSVKVVGNLLLLIQFYFDIFFELVLVIEQVFVVDIEQCLSVVFEFCREFKGLL